MRVGGRMREWCSWVREVEGERVLGIDFMDWWRLMLLVWVGDWLGCFWVEEWVVVFWECWRGFSFDDSFLDVFGFLGEVVERVFFILFILVCKMLMVLRLVVGFEVVNWWSKFFRWLIRIVLLFWVILLVGWLWL